MHNLTFSLSGSDGALEISSPAGILIARLSPVEQLELLLHISHAHLKLIDHIRVNGVGPRPMEPQDRAQLTLLDGNH